MVECSSRSRLAQEAVPRREVCRHDRDGELERHLPPELLIVREPDLAHPAGAEPTHEAVVRDVDIGRQLLNAHFVLLHSRVGEHGADVAQQRRVTRASLLQPFEPPFRRQTLGLAKECVGALRPIGHWLPDIPNGNL